MDRSRIETNKLIVISTRVIPMIRCFDQIWPWHDKTDENSRSSSKNIVESQRDERKRFETYKIVFSRHLSLETSPRSHTDPSIVRPSSNDAIDAIVPVPAAAAVVSTRIDASWIYSGLGNDPIAFAKHRLTTDLGRIAAICKR